MVITIPGRSGVDCPPLTLGCSWISKPTPWPVECENASANPSRFKTLRAASSTSPQLVPGATACTAVSCASSTASYTFRSPGFVAQENGPRHVGTVTLEDYTESRVTNPLRGNGAVSRPWGIADLSPEATIVSNDIPSAPSTLALCSSSAATAISGIPGLISPRMCSNSLQPTCAASVISASSSSSFTERRTRRKTRGWPKKAPPEADRQLSFPTRQLRHSGVRWIETCHRHARLRGQPLRCRNRRPALDDLRPPPPLLLLGLRCITSIREEARCSARHCQRGAGTSKTAKIANVRRMRDEKSGEPGACDLAAQRAHAAEMIHRDSFNTAVEAGGQ